MSDRVLREGIRSVRVLELSLASTTPTVRISRIGQVRARVML